MISIRVLLADDHHLLRVGVSFLINREPGLELVGEAGSGSETLRLLHELQPDILLLDLVLPDMKGLEIVPRVPAATRVIILSIHSELRWVRGAIQAGAAGYIVKDCSSDELVKGIRTVAAGGTFYSTTSTGSIISDYVESLSSPRDTPAQLSPREREVLSLIAQGKNTKGIAEILSISAKTVETFRMQVMRKLGINNIADLTRYAIRTGLASL